MINFRGERLASHSRIRYDYFKVTGKDNGRSVSGVHCSGFAMDLIKGNQYNHGRHQEYAWGYDGEGPQLLAIMLLGLALKDKDEAWPHNGFQYTGHLHSQRHRILSLYKDFCSEVIANLPDKWEMTSDEVLEWVKKQEQLNEHRTA